MNLSIDDQLFIRARDYLDPVRETAMPQLLKILTSEVERHLETFIRTKRGRIDWATGCRSQDAFLAHLKVDMIEAGLTGAPINRRFLCVVVDGVLDAMEEQGIRLGFTLPPALGATVQELCAPHAVSAYRDLNFVVELSGSDVPTLPATLEGLPVATALVIVEDLVCARNDTTRSLSWLTGHLEQAMATATAARPTVRVGRCPGR